jgi:hypothetical protein
MRSARGAGTSISYPFEIVHSLETSVGMEFNARDVFRDPKILGRNVVDDPVDPGPNRGIGIIGNNGEGDCSRGEEPPLEGWRNISPVTGIFRRDHTTMLEGTTLNIDIHFEILPGNNFSQG